MKTPEQMAEEYVHLRFHSYEDSYENAKSAFVDGYNAAAPKWISVKKRLPEEDMPVLVYGQILNDPPNIIGVMRRYNGDQEWRYTWEVEGGFIYREDDVTHWMPLPAPPKKKK